MGGVEGRVKGGGGGGGSVCTRVCVGFLLCRVLCV